MWADSAVFYQIYPLWLCGAPFENDGVLTHRIRKLNSLIPHLKKLGITAVYFSPLFESDTHGYNTRDYRKVDCRLGDNDDLKDLILHLHENGIRVILDGVFNHVGRGFFGFRDVQEKKWDSPYKDWFHLSFDGNSNYNDGFWYEGWEGNYDLVKLNLNNPAVTDYLMKSVKFWIDEFDIDGLRLDVAYMVDREFLKRLRRETASWKEDFFLAGEMIGGDYNVLLRDCGLHSVTNYECRKGIYSSLNSHNMFEIAYSLNRQFGNDPWTLYHGAHLLSFVDNHDVDRIASVLTDERDLKLAYALIYGMPGMPCIYYGSEWGAKGKRTDWSDSALRPEYKKPHWNELTDYIAELSRVRHDYSILAYGDYTQLCVTNEQLVFRRRDERGQLIFALNCADHPARMDFNAEAGDGVELVTRKHVDYGGGLEIAPKDAMFIYTPKE